MKTILYIIGILFFLLPSGAQLGPVWPVPVTDTIPADTLPVVKAGIDSFYHNNDSLLIKNTLTGSNDSFLLVGKPVKGVASFYSSKFEGRKTATGDIFHQAEMTGASNHFKLNTLVLVTNLRNNKSVIVLINDRMHNRMKKKGRVVDLTRNAAKQLDFIQKGLVKVSVQPITPIVDKRMVISSE